MLDPAAFRVKNALRDPSFYTAAALPVLAYFDPKAAAWITNHWQILAPYALWLAGHLGIRIQGARSLATAAAHTTPRSIVQADPSGMPAPTGCIMDDYDGSGHHTPDDPDEEG